MGISDGRNLLQKIAFQIGDKFFRFAINPDNMVQSRPHRTTAIKTKSRIVIEDFQDDVPTITISGTTGFNPTGVESDRGINKIKELKAYIKAYAEMGGNGNKSSEDFYFLDFTNHEYYVIHLSSEGITITQDVNSPLTHRYDIKFVIIREASEPSEDDVVSPEIGNRFPSLPNGTVPSGSGSGSSGSGVGSGAKDSNGNTGDGTKTNDPYDPTSGNSNVYDSGSLNNNSAVNPQAPSPTSYRYGMTGLGYAIGYYARDGRVS